jgi:hypothetical protein
VFGGLYLPHLRASVWRNLAQAEAELRRGEGLEVQELDLDGDGHAEWWVHSAAFSACISPSRGGALEEFSLFDRGPNLADTLTRRPEAYHEEAAYDREPRALFVDRVLPASVTLETFASGDFAPVHSWAGRAFATRSDPHGESFTLELTAAEPRLEKRYRFGATGDLEVSWSWDAGAFPPDSVFTTELSLAQHLEVAATPTAEVWTHAITTTAKSERGLEETVQGQSVTLRWPVGEGRAAIRLVGG